MQLFTANFIKYGAKVWLKKHAIKLFHYSSIVYDLHDKELDWRITCVLMLSMTQQLAYKLEFLELSLVRLYPNSIREVEVWLAFSQENIWHCV